MNMPPLAPLAYRWSSMAVTMVVLLCTTGFASSSKTYKLDWQDRTQTQQADGSMADIPPKVTINGIALSRFSSMQQMELAATLQMKGENGPEIVHVFLVWQGGATKGQQIMLLTTSNAGIDVIGPYEQEFDSLKITPARDNQGPLFMLYGGEKSAGDTPFAILTYDCGKIIAVD